jgi:NAD(P)-dependent dehydrogenase (short-subunit alcohol dehydrogenase family)
MENHAEAFLRILNINVVGTFNVLREVAMTMVKNSPSGKFQQRGVIINVGSTMGIEAPNRSTLYAATKGAVHGMTMPLARDLGKFGVRVVTVAPGPFNTPMLGTGSSMDPEAKKQLVKHEKLAALGRLGESDEFADTCFGIIGSSFMTGNVVRLDGGLRLPKL